MSHIIAEHKHLADRSPAGNPQRVPFLLQIRSNENTKKPGLTIEADPVASGRPQLYVVLEGPSESAVRLCLAPFGQVDSLKVLPAAHGEEVVARGRG